MAGAPIVVKAQVVGVPELQQQFQRLVATASAGHLVTAVQAGAVIIRNEAAQRAPKRTRTLARSIHIEVLESGRNHCMVAIGTDVEYAAIHEFGGVILPKRAKFLAIPVGEMRGSPRLHDLNVATTRSGQYVLVDQAGSVQYLLRQSVTIPARPYLRPALDAKGDEALQEIGTVLRQILERAL